jgi:hypothetical protein
MDANPARRYQTALAFAGALEEATRAEPVAAVAVAPIVPAVVPVPDPEPSRVVAPPPQTVDDDIASERDEDEAHHQLTLRERDRADLEDSLALADDDKLETEPEADADRLFIDSVIGAAADSNIPYREDDYDLTPPPSREREPALPEMEQESAESPLVAPVRRSSWETDREHQRPAVERQYDYRPAAAVVPAQRSRVLPLAVLLSIGLLVGFAVGFGVGSRGPSTEPAQSEATNPSPAAAPSAAKPYSEQAVTPPQNPSRQPTTSPAPVASESPSPAPARSTGVAAATSGNIQVRSTPPNAGVTVNGRWRGRTPLSLEKLPFGRYSVRIVQPGYVVAREDFTLTSEDASRTLSVRLQEEAAAPRAAPAKSPAAKPAAAKPPPQPAPAAASKQSTEPARGRPGTYTGSVYVDSRPRGARVFLDGKAVGTTPVSVPDVAIGSHVVRLEMPDHRSWSAVTRVSAGRQERVTGSLERIQ